MYYSQARWSKWCESMRKDVECTFGILKGRWRILKTGVRLEGLETVDNIWYTCCALHNMLLHIDGLNNRWTQGIASDYEGEFGWHDEGSVERYNQPAVYERMANPRLYDASLSHSMPPRVHHEAEVHQHRDNGGAVRVNSVPFETFRNYLVNHFHILFQKREIVWPSRTGIPQPNVQGVVL